MSQEETGKTETAENKHFSGQDTSAASFNPEDGQKKHTDNSITEASARQCPFCQISPSVLEKLIRPPFRKRHPFIFWSLAIVIVLFCASLFLDEEDTTERIALVNIEGPILDSAADIAWISSITQNRHVKGILARINSPGGGAAASQEIYYALKEAAKNKPVVVSMGATAASGGLMISMAGERIFANPSTITGSIGVRMDIPQLQGLLGKLGISQETLVSGPYKDAASYLHPLTPEDREYLQAVIDNMYEQFVQIVASSRKLDPERAKQLANGKIYTGQQALELGLIDELGTRQEALAWICDKTSIPVQRGLLEKRSKNNGLMDLVFRYLGKKALQESFGIIRGELQPGFLYQ